LSFGGGEDVAHSNPTAPHGFGPALRPNQIDQMKFFELIQIIPSPTKSALRSGNLLDYRISDARIMGYLRNNSVFAFGQADRARTSATLREILDGMWLFTKKFETALARYDEVKAGR